MNRTKLIFAILMILQICGAAPAEDQIVRVGLVQMNARPFDKEYYCTSDFSRPLLVHLYQTRALENCLYIARVNFAAPRNSGTSAIIHFDGYTEDELDRAEGVLVANLNLTELRKSRADWDQVYGSRYRYPRAYKRLSSP